MRHRNGSLVGSVGEWEPKRKCVDYRIMVIEKGKPVKKADGEEFVGRETLPLWGGKMTASPP